MAFWVWGHWGDPSDAEMADTDCDTSADAAKWFFGRHDYSGDCLVYDKDTMTLRRFELQTQITVHEVVK